MGHFAREQFLVAHFLQHNFGNTLACFDICIFLNLCAPKQLAENKPATICTPPAYDLPKLPLYVTLYLTMLQKSEKLNPSIL